VENLGICFDADANRQATRGTGELISATDSPTKVMVLATDEESVIYNEVMKEIDQPSA
jgi:acetate kinase